MQRKFYFKSLELENFMIFPHKVLNFAEDLSLIVGRNGSGKSAILDALALSFQVKERTTSVQNYIHCGQNVAKLRLTCSWMNQDLIIESIFTAKGARRIQRNVYYNGQTYQDTVANKFLLEFFDNSVVTVAFAMQGNEKFLTASKALNLKNMINLLQLDFTKELLYSKEQGQTFEKAKTNSLGSINKQQGSKEILLSNIQTYKNQLETLKSEKAYLDNTQVESTDQLDTLIIEKRLQLKKLQDVQNDTIEKLNTKNQLKTQLDNTHLDIQRIEAQLVQIPSLDVQDVLAFIQKSNELNTEITNLQNRFNEILEQINELNVTIANTRTTQRIELDRFSKLQSGICPTCSQQIAQNITIDLNTKIKELAEDIEKFEKNLNDLTQTRNQINTDINTKNQELHENQQAQQRVEIHNKTVESNSQLKTTLEDSKARLQAALVDLQQRYDAAVAEYEKCSTDSSPDIQKLNTELTSLESQRGVILDLQNKRQLNTVSIQNCEQGISQAEGQLSQVEVSIQDESTALQKSQDSIEVWKQAQDVFNLLPKLYLKQFLKDIESVCSSIVSQFGYPSLKVDSDEKGISFFLIRFVPGTANQIEVPYEMCSAFEKNLINLSLIYTLTRMFRAPFVCIDELDASADVENTQKLGELIQLIIQYTPVVTVSHDTSLVSSLAISSYKTAIIRTEEES